MGHDKTFPVTPGVGAGQSASDIAHGQSYGGDHSRMTGYSSGDKHIHYGSESPTRYTGSGQGGGGCFAARTMVLMADGSEKAIEEIVVGDMVRTPLHGTMRSRRVTKVSHHALQCVIMLRTTGDTVVVTPNHRFRSGGKWMRADEMKIGDRIAGHPHSVKIIERDSREICVVFNIYVEESSSFFANGLCVCSYSWWPNVRCFLNELLHSKNDRSVVPEPVAPSFG